VRIRTAYAAPQGSLHITKFGVVQRSGYRITKLTYETEPGILIPAMLFVLSSARQDKPPIVYVHGRGKSVDAAVAGEIEKLTRAGHTVLAVDTRGSGETAVLEPQDGQKYSGYFGDYSNTMKALLLGRTLVGMRAADIVRAVEVVAAETGVAPREVFAVGKENGGVPLLHAAMLDERFRKVVLDGVLRSYRDVVDSTLHRGVFDAVLLGVLHDYDLGDLVAALGWKASDLHEKARPGAGCVPGGNGRRELPVFLSGRAVGRLLRKQKGKA
jgi:cephalosporin-C deacetylase-like acetyl esterase